SKSSRVQLSTNHNNSFYNTDIFSDVVVICDGHEIKAHRLMLSAHSEYFANQLNGPWKENSEQKVEIKDFDLSAICIASTIPMNNIAALKKHAMGIFGVAIDTGWSMDDFPLAVVVTYDTTPPEDRGLRDLVVATCHANIDKLLINDSFCKVLRTTIDFAADLVPFLHGNVHNSGYRCPSCRFRNNFKAVEVWMGAAANRGTESRSLATNKERNFGLMSSSLQNQI
ncbi:hypothetical protein S40288_09570, partial [Stachybotrys chartarum IBT 40288]